MKVLRCITAVCALLATNLVAQENEIPRGERLRGKVGVQLESRNEPELMPRTLKLERLNVSDEVRDAFLAKLSEEKSPEDLDRLREMRIDRMKRKLGTSRSEAEAIREDFGIEAPLAPKPKQVVEEPEDSSIRDLLGVFLCLSSVFGFTIWRMRRS